MWRKADLWGGLFWLALGIGAAWQGLALGYGVLNDPGTGFMVFWAGLLIAGFAAAILVDAVLGAQGPSLSALWAGTRWQRVVVVVLALAAYAAAFRHLGFILCTLALLTLLLRGVERVRWTVAIPVVLVATFGTWYVVTRWLKILLPVGVLG
jgi:putative tricarboxylic transport membrane protein